MKDVHNMTGEQLYTSGLRGDYNYQKPPKNTAEKKEPKFGFWDFVLSAIFLICFFGCIIFYFENRTLKEEIEQKHLLIMDLAKLLERKNAK